MPTAACTLPAEEDCVAAAEFVAEVPADAPVEPLDGVFGKPLDEAPVDEPAEDPVTLELVS